MQLTQEFRTYPPIADIFGLVSDREDAVFLDSSLTNELGRCSIVALNPYLKLVKGETFTVNGETSELPFEDYVKRYLRTHREEKTLALPLTAGAVGYFSYDYGREKEKVASRHTREVEIPDCVLIFYDNFIIEDHEKKRLHLIANDHGQNCERGMEELLKLLRVAEAQEKRAGMVPAGSVTANFTGRDYMDAVRRMMDYIAEGDIYIANMTQQLQIRSDMPPYEMFCRLRRENPSPFGGYFNYGDFQVVCASPERFLQMREGRIQTRPIKGTRKRGSTPKEDASLRLELERSEKDKSELLMIVDLERNDLNRVCVPGSVQVTELFSVETYATVFHLVSNVVGELRPDLTVMDLLEAAFPGGSITGAPKLRAMELIDELEHGRRNIYTGSMGYLSLNGDCDFNIVIRTALYRDGNYYLGVGGGITCESEPEFEYEETLQKAKALLAALKAAEPEGAKPAS